MVTAIITGIITSLIASIIFYMVFNLIPERRKTNAIRPRIEIELVEISESLFFFIEVAFRHSEYTASMFQTNLRERTITEDDFRIGLQNKCLSKGYLYDSNSDGMLIVGHMLEKLSSEVCRKIDRVLSNQVFLSSEEILIVEQVERILNALDFHMPPETIVNGYVLRAVDPSISSMSASFYELFMLYNDLKDLAYCYKLIRDNDRKGSQKYMNLQCEYIELLIAKSDYHKAKRKIEKLKHLYGSPIIILAMELRLAMQRNDLVSAKDVLTKILSDPDRDLLVYNRGYIGPILQSEELMGKCRELCDDSEIKKWLQTVHKEEQHKEAFLQHNRELMEYYESKNREIEGMNMIQN